jgi:ferredoxin/nitrate reductase gamma subunit
MSARVDPTLLHELKAYGAVGIEKCFNCGNCTAICPLTSDDHPFPRSVIRLAQVGLRDRLQASVDPWLCYYCGECSATCPKTAEPGEFMAAARRFAIAKYDVTGLAGALYRSAWFSVIFTVALTLLFSLFLLSVSQPAPTERLALFEFIPEVYIQIVGLAVFGIAGLATVAGIVRMTRHVSGLRTASGRSHGVDRLRLNWRQALQETMLEVLGQKRYRHEDCEENSSTPWYLRKWVVHATVLYGFLGLFAATALDFLFKPVGSMVPLYYPMRLLGTSAGILFMYGTSVAMVKRLQERDKSASHSHHSDWMFLTLLWLVGLTGFLLEIGVYALLPAAVSYILLIMHVALAMDLLVLLPFGKFAHVYYRTAALFLHSLKPLEQTEGSLPLSKSGQA